jgi:hypothetical protein
MKNSVVTTAIAEVLVVAGWLVVVAVFPTLAIAMKLISSLCGVLRPVDLGPPSVLPAFNPLPDASNATRRSYRIRRNAANVWDPQHTLSAGGATWAGGSS